MDKRKVCFLSLLLVTSIVLYLLISGSTILTKTLDKKGAIPLGTFITWVGMVSLPLTFFWGIKELREPTNKLNIYLNRMLKAVIVLAILWPLISYLLAGNLSYTFSNTSSFQGGQIAMEIFWYISYGIGIGAILVLFIYWCSLLFKRKKHE